MTGPDLRGWVHGLASLADAGGDASRIDQIRLLEDIKSACAAAQARLTAAFAASQRAINIPRAGATGTPAAGEPGAGAASDPESGAFAPPSAIACAPTPTPAPGPDGTGRDLDSGEMRSAAGGSRGKQATERRAKAERLARRSAAAQVALARRESPQRGGRFVGLADALTAEMPHTLAALGSGVINEWRAMIIVRDTACLTSDQRRQVDEEIAGNLDGLGDARIHALVTAISYRLDPEAATARSVRAASDRRVNVRPAPDAMAYLSGLMPITAAVSCYAALCRHVDTQPAAPGDTRTRDQRIVDEYISRLTGAAGWHSGARGSASGAGGGAGGSAGSAGETAGVAADGSSGGAGGPAGGSAGAAGEPAGGSAGSAGGAAGAATATADGDGDGRSPGSDVTAARCGSGPDDPVAASDPMAASDPVADLRAAYQRAVAESAVAGSASTGGACPMPSERADHPECGARSPARHVDRQGRQDERPDQQDERRGQVPSPPHGRAPAERSAWGIPPGTDVMLNVVITDRALLAGGDDPAVLPGNHPIPAPLMRRMLTDLPTEARVWVRRLYTRPDTGELVAQDSRRRAFPPPLRRLLLTRDQTCRTPWCNAPSRHADHVTPAAAGGPTSLDNGQGLSEDCNYRRTAPGWSAWRDPDRPGDIVVSTPTGHRYRSPCPDLIPGHTRHTRPPAELSHRVEALLEWQLTGTS